MLCNGMQNISVLTETNLPEIKKLFKNDIEDFLKISHFSVILITPEKNAYIVSTSKEFSDNFRENDLHKFDNTLSSVMYENLKFYSWAEGYVKIRQDDIRKIKESYMINNGVVFVRKVAEYIVLYCVATREKDPIMKTIFVNQANSILKRGDYVYNEIINNLEEYCGVANLPKIEKFFPFLHEEIPCLINYENEKKKKIISIIREDIHEKRIEIKDFKNNK